MINTSRNIDMNRNEMEYGLDYFKLIASLFVVGMHMEFLKDVGEVGYKIADYIFRFAVPFFFMSSGFLFEGHGFQKHDDVKKYGKKFIKKLIIPFVLWGGVYAVIDIVGDVFIDKIPMVDACVTKLCEILTESPGGGLWYIYSLIWIVIVLIFIYDPQKDKSFLMLTTAFLLLYFLKAMWKTPAIEIGIIQWTRNVYTLIFSSDRTFLFHGIFYIIGMILAKKKRKLKKVSPLVVGLLLLINYGIYYISGLYETTVAGGLLCQFFRLMVTICLIWLALVVNLPKGFRDDTLSKIMREMSTIIYFSHFFLIYMLRFLAKICDINYTDNLTLLCVISWCALLAYSWIISTNNRYIKLKKMIYPI